MAASTTKRAAPAKRAPAKTAKATAPSAQADQVIATDPAPATDDPRVGLRPGEAWITLAGRDLVVTVPNEAQLAVWPRTIDRLQNATKNMGAEDAVKLLGRVLSLLESVLADEDDKLWLEDQLLQGGMSLEDAAQIMVLAAEEFAKLRGGKAPTTGPQPKARRRR